jgi:pilus assembly protein CpaE
MERGITPFVLIDPDEESRRDLGRVIRQFEHFKLVGTHPSYEAITGAVAPTGSEVVLVVLDHAPEQAEWAIRELARSNPNVPVLPAGRRRDREAIQRLAACGVQSFLDLPADATALAEAIAPLGIDRPRLIAVTGATGGVGRTSLAVGLAARLARNPGQSVALADFNLPHGGVATRLNLTPAGSLGDAVAHWERLDATLLKAFMTEHAPSGLHVLTTPQRLTDALALRDGEDCDRLGAALERTLLLLRASFHTTVVDTGKDLNPSDALALRSADTILLVARPTVDSLSQSVRLIELLAEVPGLLDRVRVVLNQVGASHHEVAIDEALRALTRAGRASGDAGGPEGPTAGAGKVPRWVIPYVRRAFERAGAEGVPVGAVAPGGRIDRALGAIAGAFQIQRSWAAIRPLRRAWWGSRAALI